MTSRRVVLVASTRTYRAGAFIEAARRIGAPITIASEWPQALAAANPAGHLVLDPARLGPAVDAIADFAAREPVGAVVAADDDGAILAALARERLGLPGHAADAVRLARDKLLMRERLRAAGLPGPRFLAFDADSDPARAAREVRFPCVLKPRALSASRGVMRADDPEEFAVAFRRLAGLLARIGALDDAGGGAVLVEDYLPGAEVAVEGLVDAGRFRALAIFDKPDPLEGPFFEETIYVTPSRHPPGTRAAIVDTAVRTAAALGLRDGPVHAELRVVGGLATPIEIAPRSIGGLCSRALRFGDDRTLEELILGQALGLDVAGLEREACASGVLMIPIPRAGRLREVRHVGAARAVPAIEDVRITTPPGAALTPLPDGARYLGFVFARAATPQAVEAALRRAHAALEFDIEPEPAGEGA